MPSIRDKQDCWVRRQWMDRQTDPRKTYETCQFGEWLANYMDEKRPWTAKEKAKIAAFLCRKIKKVCPALCKLVPKGFEEHEDALETRDWSRTHCRKSTQWLLSALQRHIGRLAAYQEMQAHDFDIAFVAHARAAQDKALRQLDSELADEIRRIFGPDWPKEVTGD